MLTKMMQNTLEILLKDTSGQLWQVLFNVGMKFKGLAIAKQTKYDLEDSNKSNDIFHFID